jgi:hypothetical protein
MTRFVRSGLRLAAASLVVAGLVATAAASSEAASSPSITVSPNTGLHNKQVVKISGSGFSKNTDLAIVECNPSVFSANPKACNAAGAIQLKTGSGGSFPATNFTVVAGKVGDGQCGTSPSTATCYIFASPPNNTSFANVGDSTIKFTVTTIAVKPSTKLHGGEAVSVTGQGFSARVALDITECTPAVLNGASTKTACTKKHMVAVTATAAGRLGPTTFKVVSGQVGNGNCGTTAKTLTCYIRVAPVKVTGINVATAAVKFALPTM